MSPMKPKSAGSEPDVEACSVSTQSGLNKRSDPSVDADNHRPNWPRVTRATNTKRIDHMGATDMVDDRATGCAKFFAPFQRVILLSRGVVNLVEYIVTAVSSRSGKKVTAC